MSGNRLFHQNLIANVDSVELSIHIQQLMKRKPKGFNYSRAFKRSLVALFTPCILTFVMVNPWDVNSPGLAGGMETNITNVSGSRAGEGKALKNNLCYLNVNAPLPYLRRGKPTKQFEKLRRAVISGAGFDFLSICGDMLRLRGNTVSIKPGAIHRSRHKSGEAFDYNQDDPRLLLVREYREGRTYWRTYLRCEKQDGTLGARAELHTDNAGFVSAYVFDFTSAAERLGWERIHAQSGWGQISSKKEYWHYELTEGISFDDAMSAIYNDAHKFTLSPAR